MEWLQHAWEVIAEAVDPNTIVQRGGLWLLAAVIFAETGIMVGFFLPGDSLLFVAGVLAANHTIAYPLWVVILVVIVAAFLGDSLGYFIGQRGGRSLLRRKNTFWFKQEYVTMTKKFYDRYGGQALVLGRFLPIIRTFAPVLAGVVHLNYFRFIVFNVTGAILWVCTLVPLGYFLGREFRDEIERYNTYIIIGFVAVTTIPIVFRVLKERSKLKKAQAEAAATSPPEGGAEGRV